VGWAFIVRSRDLEAYRRCRRAWDLGAQVRQRYVPAIPPPFDFDKAIHDALAVYYLPAMDDWKRFIVRPLAFKGFERSMAESRVAHEKVTALTPAEVEDFDRHMVLGQALMTNFFAWAAQVDDFESIFSDHEVWTAIPDPDAPGWDLGMPDLRPIRYLGRLDQLISDPSDEYWAVNHRLVQGGWSDPEALMADDTALRNCWGIQIAYPSMVIAGTITNELRLDGQTEVEPPDEIIERDVREMTGSRHLNIRRSYQTPEQRAAVPLNADGSEPDQVVMQEDNGLFRRTVIRRSQQSIARAGVRVGREVAEMRDLNIAVPPVLSPSLCATCQFQAPCAAMESGGDWQALLAVDFRQVAEDSEEESLRHSSVRQMTKASMTGVELHRRHSNRR
jgi:hypothetical protein